MAVEVKVTSVLQKITGAKVVRGEGGTVAELLSNLDTQYPGFKNQIMQEGALHRFVNIYLNDEDIRYLDQLDTRVKEAYQAEPPQPIAPSAARPATPTTMRRPVRPLTWPSYA